MKSSFQIDGFDEYASVLEKAGERINPVARATLSEAKGMLESEMKRRVVKDTWNLHNQIRTFTPSREGDFNYVRVGLIDPDKRTAIYANVVEYGSVRTKARPFVRPTISANKRKIIEMFRARLKAAGLVD